jgi:hypothetical protein
MGKLEFRKTQLDAVNDRLLTLARIGRDKLPKLLEETVEAIKRDVIASAPIRSGNLRHSVYTTVNETKARVEVDTTRTDPRPSSRNFEYGRVVEHGRAGQYKTTPFWYKNVEKRLSEVHEKLRKIFIDIKTRK